MSKDTPEKVKVHFSNHQKGSRRDRIRWKRSCKSHIQSLGLSFSGCASVRICSDSDAEEVFPSLPFLCLPGTARFCAQLPHRLFESRNHWLHHAGEMPTTSSNKNHRIWQSSSFQLWIAWSYCFGILHHAFLVRWKYWRSLLPCIAVAPDISW